MKWVLESLKSCRTLNEKFNIAKINIPVFIATAEHEALVDNEATQKLSNQLPNADIIEIPNAKHEILMEVDEVRDVFTQKFFNLALQVS